MAGDDVAVAGQAKGRLLGRAAGLRVRAAGPEPAARRRIDRARDVAGEDDPLAAPFDPRVGDRYGRDERLRVGVQRPAEQVVHGGGLDDLAEVHHGDPVGEVPDHGEVMGDEHDRQPEPGLELLEKGDDLGLDRHVERADRLVADQQVRLQDQGAGDADSLPLAAAQLARIAVVERLVEAHRPQQLVAARSPLRATADAVDVERLADDGAGGEPRIERRVGILEDHLEPSARPAQRCPVERRDLFPAKAHLPVMDSLELDDRPAGGALAAAALPDEREGLALGDVERDAVDGSDEAAAAGVLDEEVLDLEERGSGGRRRAGHRRIPATAWRGAPVVTSTQQAIR